MNLRINEWRNGADDRCGSGFKSAPTNLPVLTSQLSGGGEGVHQLNELSTPRFGIRLLAAMLIILRGVSADQRERTIFQFLHGRL